MRPLGALLRKLSGLLAKCGLHFLKESIPITPRGPFVASSG